MKQENILILNDIRSIENVGAMFRTADAAGIDKIYTVGYTPAPIDRFGRKRSDLHKAALGAEEYVAWEAVSSIATLINKLKKNRFQIIAVEQAPNSVDYRKVKMGTKNAFIMGNEVTGVPKKVLDKCDVVAEIPMRGKKESLNVSVSCGVALFGMLR
ncbi:MAG TPA: TrmH family RNA methyltransferase [Candidatus Paceibacterota bacterium]